MRKTILIALTLIISITSFSQLPTLLKTEVLKKPNCVKYDSAKIKLTFSKGIDTSHTLCLNRKFDSVIYSANRDTATVLNLRYDSATVISNKGFGKYNYSKLALYAFGRLNDVLRVQIDTTNGKCSTTIPIDTIKIKSAAGWVSGTPFYPVACGKNDTIDLDFLGVSPVLLTVTDTGRKKHTFHKFSANDMAVGCYQSPGPTIYGTCTAFNFTIKSGDGCPIYESGTLWGSSTVAIHVYIQPIVASDTVYHTICKNDSIQFSKHKLAFVNSRIYTDYVEASWGCDSLVKHNITVINPYDSATFDTIKICNGDTAFFADGSFTTMAITDTTFVASSAICDSVIITKVSIRPTTITNVTATSCIGQTYYFLDGDSTKSSGMDTSILKTINGCDSLIITSLTMSYQLAKDTMQHFLCKGDSVLIGSSYISTSSFVQDTVSGFCDTVRHHNVLVFNPFAKPTIKSAYFCPGDTVYFADSSFTTTQGIDTTILKGKNGCDSILITNVYMLSQSLKTYSDSICMGYVYTFPNGKASRTAKVDTSVFKGQNGCDSIIVVDLKVNTISITQVQANTCKGNWYKFPNGDSSNLSVMDTSRFFNRFGCDSMVVTTLTIDSVPYSISKPNICKGNWYVFPDGDSSNVSSTDTSLLQNSSGCDSIIYTILTLVNIDTVLSQNGDTIVAKSGYNSYQWFWCGPLGLNILNGETLNSYVIDSSGSYAVVIEQNQCKDSSACVTMAITPIIFIGLSEKSKTTKWILYPNPVESQLNIKPELQNATLKVYAVDGRIVYSNENLSGGNLNLSLPAGNYLVEIREGDQREWFKLIKK